MTRLTTYTLILAIGIFLGSLQTASSNYDPRKVESTVLHQGDEVFIFARDGKVVAYHKAPAVEKLVVKRLVVLPRR